MFVLAILIGIYGYGILNLGLVAQLYTPIILSFTLAYWIGAGIWVGRNYHILRSAKSSYRKVFFPEQREAVYLCCLFLLLGLVNLIGALGPELAFDALWYHLTLPKLYLSEHAVRFIPGGLLYYSAMPKLTEMLYTAALALQGEILAKLIHFLFGIGTCIVLYKMARNYFSRIGAVIAVLIFYSNLVVAWESTTAYIDLSRTFFEALALWAFLLFTDKEERKYLLLTGVMIGLAISTKLLALGSAAIFMALLLIYCIHKKQSARETLVSLIQFIVPVLLIPSPWFVFSYLNTGNPVYPFFSSLYEAGFSPALLSPLTMTRDFRDILLFADDPVSPVYLMVLPLVFVWYRRLSEQMRYVLLYTIFALIIWYITPRTGGGRFIMPYLPALSLLAAGIIELVRTMKKKPVLFLYRYLVLAVVLTAVITVLYRGAANSRYVSVVSGREAKAAFLSRHLNFSFGDFYDTDGFLMKAVSGDKRVLLYGFHNLYYMPVPFLHESWVKKGDRFDYIATQNAPLPERFRYWREIYYNPVTGMKVYYGGQEWIY
jgi:4-amino-4-deoxy-L-arabinose transferase-like glycosyltransferase